MLALSAFLASTASTFSLQMAILPGSRPSSYHIAVCLIASAQKNLKKTNKITEFMINALTLLLPVMLYMRQLFHCLQ